MKKRHGKMTQEEFDQAWEEGEDVELQEMTEEEEAYMHSDAWLEGGEYNEC